MWCLPKRIPVGRSFTLYNLTLVEYWLKFHTKRGFYGNYFLFIRINTLKFQFLWLFLSIHLLIIKFQTQQKYFRDRVKMVEVKVGEWNHESKRRPDKKRKTSKRRRNDKVIIFEYRVHIRKNTLSKWLDIKYMIFYVGEF